MKKIAIIGASGEVGFKLVDKLSKNYFLKCIVRDKNKKNFSNIKNVELFEINDIGLTHQISKAISDVDVIINTGYISFAQDIFDALELIDSKPEQIIFTGSTGIYTKLPSKGAKLKIDAEKFIMDNYKISWTIIRPTMIYGHHNDRNISRLIRVLNKTPIMPLIGNGDFLIQPVFIDDLLKSYEIAILNTNHYKKSYNIGSCKPLTNKDLFKTVANILEKRVYFISISPKIISFLLKFLKLIKIKPISQEQVLRFQENKDIDIFPFINNFKFEPIPFQEGVSRQVAEMKNKNCL